MRTVSGDAPATKAILRREADGSLSKSANNPFPNSFWRYRSIPTVPTRSALNLIIGAFGRSVISLAAQTRNDPT